LKTFVAEKAQKHTNLIVIPWLVKKVMKVMKVKGMGKTCATKLKKTKIRFRT